MVPMNDRGFNKMVHYATRLMTYGHLLHSMNLFCRHLKVFYSNPASREKFEERSIFALLIN